MKSVDCIILSTGRAASTAIYQYINIGGSLNLPINKEPHFWCELDKYGGIYNLLSSIKIRNYHSYLQLYVNSRKIIDGSVGYFFYLEDVIGKLIKYNQHPKVIFLYREPVGRAKSLFNELKKKRLTSADTVSDDIRISKKEGLWWEYYYDNVYYYDNFQIIKENFDQSFLVNYDYFKNNQKVVIISLANFLCIDPIRLESIDFTPVNTSNEAILSSKFRFLRVFGRYLPTEIRKHLTTKIGHYFISSQKPISIDLQDYLQSSIVQYEMFRKHINYEDMLCIKK